MTAVAGRLARPRGGTVRSDIATISIRTSIMPAATRSCRTTSEDKKDDGEDPINIRARATIYTKSARGSPTLRVPRGQPCVSRAGSASKTVCVFLSAAAPPRRTRHQQKKRPNHHHHVCVMEATRQRSYSSSSGSSPPAAGALQRMDEADVAHALSPDSAQRELVRRTREEAEGGASPAAPAAGSAPAQPASAATASGPFPRAALHAQKARSAEEGARRNTAGIS